MKIENFIMIIILIFIPLNFAFAGGLIENSGKMWLLIFGIFSCSSVIVAGLWCGHSIKKELKEAEPYFKYKKGDKVKLRKDIKSMTFTTLIHVNRGSSGIKTEEGGYENYSNNDIFVVDFLYPGNGTTDRIYRLEDISYNGGGINKIGGSKQVFYVLANLIEGEIDYTLTDMPMEIGNYVSFKILSSYICTNFENDETVKIDILDPNSNLFIIEDIYSREPYIYKIRNLNYNYSYRLYVPHNYLKKSDLKNMENIEANIIESKDIKIRYERNR